MCGIAGWVDFYRDIFGEDKQMADISASLAPRGPDDSGAYKTHECYFVHRRLIVIDPENGKQPMTKEQYGQRYTLCYNGELYNSEELTRRLKGMGYQFRGHCDTEVLLTAYMAWGERCVDEFNGIYAFAVWEETGRKLFLARDRIGVKPLFYHLYDGGIIFASEIKALLAHRFVRAEIDENGAASVALLGPARTGGDGVFRDIKELKPGECAAFGKDSGFKKRSYWFLQAKPHPETVSETAVHVKNLLFDAIDRQLVSDVPLCTFLSGGLDSSVISAVAARKFAAEGKGQLHTYSVDYKGNRENFRKSLFQPDEDAPYIEEMSEFIGSRHTNVIIDTPELIDALTASTNAKDLPGMADVDSSLYLFCREVKKDFAVAISGECADELFGGYPWYHNDEILFAEGFPWQRSAKERAGLLKPGLLGDIDPMEYVNGKTRETASHATFLGSDDDKSRRQREMFCLNFYWFMQTLLDRKDRCSMAHGLEVRVPFCDHRIAEYAYNIPWEMKALRGREKGIVRLAMDGVLPDSIVWRKKSPYPKTHNPLYSALVKAGLAQILEKDDCHLTEIFNADKLRELVDSDGHSFDKNWYGQLMNGPQVFAYLIQTEHWMREYNVKLV
jgi:asparagine synthase (glutamine-hydrolysing)